jgi:Tfp pilus assembly protein PilF
LNTTLRKIFFVGLIISPLLIVFFLSCGENKSGTDEKAIANTDASLWLNHTDSAKYVGKETCKRCHEGIYNTFMQTGMGKSFGLATKSKSASDFSHAVIYDKYSDFYYKAFWSNDTFRILEFRLKGKDTIHKRFETIDFIVGSGQHTNSHLQMVNGYINQAPMTFYTQKKKWDLPPGFENGHNTRFSRLIGLECMSCHNAYPQFEEGSENKFTAVPDGIDCERCHGPGSIHVADKMNGKMVDTSKQIDYSIVNPAKLSVERQFDVCMRCHLQGNAVLAKNKSWYDFKPGMKLNDYITVFLPKYKNAEDEFIMASHADRLKQSKCFIHSLEKSKTKSSSLRPYKDALTCVTCHNPHVSVKQTSTEHFNSVCSNCHSKQEHNWCTEKEKVLQTNEFNCVTCHMPWSGSKDIPHVSIHDHYIRKPMNAKEVKAVKEFIGLYAINARQVDSLTMARAYINQYEKFEQQNYYLDSAMKFIGRKTTDENFETKVQLLFAKNDLNGIRSLCESFGVGKLLSKSLVNKSVTNENAWTCYRIGEAFSESSEYPTAEKFYEKACDLAEFHPDFKIKYGVALMMNGKKDEARKLFTDALIENPRFVPALVNLGYLDAVEGKINSAEKNYKKAFALDPDNLTLLTNFGGLKLMQNKFDEGAELLFTVLKNKNSGKKPGLMIVNLVSVLMEQRKFSDSEKILKRYLKMFPTDKEALILKTQLDKLKNGKSS